MKYHYPFTYKQAVKCIIYGIIVSILFIMLWTSSNFNRVYIQFYGYIFLIGIFVYKYFFFQRKIKEKIYISGSFEMSYEEIKEIVDVKTYDIMGTEIKKCEILTKNGKKCMEKFIIDEYNFLCSLCMVGEKYD